MGESEDDVGRATREDTAAGGTSLQEAMAAHCEILNGQREPPPSERADANCITVWLPVLEAAGIPVPRTQLIDAGEDWWHLTAMLGSESRDEAKGRAVLERLKAEIVAAGDAFGWPLFLRTGHFSGKHEWDKACHVPGPGDVGRHVLHLCEMSEMYSMCGELPYRHWAAREMLPTNPLERLANYGGMPLVPEVRAFIDGGEVVCHHGYWPEDAIRKGLDTSMRPKTSVAAQLLYHGDGVLEPAEGATEPTESVLNECRELAAYDCVQKVRAEGLHAESLRRIPSGWRELAERVAVAFERPGTPLAGPWSVDILPAGGGLYVTDMARAGASYHQQPCPHAGLGRGERRG